MRLRLCHARPSSAVTTQLAAIGATDATLTPVKISAPFVGVLGGEVFG